jgi:hypothetical protein
VTLESWGARAAFAVRVGAPIWFVTAVAVALYARRAEAGDGGAGMDDDAAPDDEADSDDDAAQDDDREPTDDDGPTANDAGKRD